MEGPGKLEVGEMGADGLKNSRLGRTGTDPGKGLC